MAIDHVMYGVADLDEATEMFERDLDLPVTEGVCSPTAYETGSSDAGTT